MMTRVVFGLCMCCIDLLDLSGLCKVVVAVAVVVLYSALLPACWTISLQGVPNAGIPWSILACHSMCGKVANSKDLVYVNGKGLKLLHAKFYRYVKLSTLVTWQFYFTFSGLSYTQSNCVLQFATCTQKMNVAHDQQVSHSCTYLHRHDSREF